MEITAAEWAQFLEDKPEIHILQSLEWGELKRNYGWHPVYVVEGDTGAQILFRSLPLGLTIAYIPKGPVGIPDCHFWKSVDAVCRKHHAIFLKVEPDSWECKSEGWWEDASEEWVTSDTIQPRQTIVIPLDGDEQEWLSRMSQKTRYNVRLAQKKDVQVIASDDISSFHQLMQVTGQRDEFGVHSLAYYQDAYRHFSTMGNCVLLAATYSGRWLAALMAFRRGSRAWYFYGASSDEERNRMPTYLLQWEAMKWAATCGCKTYDLWGVPDVPEQDLEENFTRRSDGLWGVYRFKRGFGGMLMRSIGAWDRVYKRGLYRLYQLYRRRNGGQIAHSQ